jgi:hypothetical protein
MSLISIDVRCLVGRTNQILIRSDEISGKLPVFLVRDHTVEVTAYGRKPAQSDMLLTEVGPDEPMRAPALLAVGRHLAIGDHAPEESARAWRRLILLGGPKLLHPRWIRRGTTF